MPTSTTATELFIDFGPIAPDAPEETPVTFSVRNPATGEAWSRGQFRSLLDARALADIHWYLEEYVQWPFGPFRDRAHAIEAQLEAHGRALFAALFDDREPARIYQSFLDTPATVRTLTLIADAPRVLRLPWELLAESSGPLFTKRPPISIRRQVRLEHAPRVGDFALPLRILMVVARPDNAGFVDPRSVARGALDALEELGGAATLDFLRPPTLASLDETLRAAADAGQPYHIVHFDGHGVYSPHTGLGQLAFERSDHTTDLVDANRLGTLLNECGIPLVVLNACQSAQGDQANPFSSVATRLLEAGVGGVLSMSHSVLVVTAARFMASFYQALVRGATVSRAVDDARRTLVQDTRRFTHAQNPTAAEESITLHDWFLPVLYQQRADAAPFAGASPVTAHPSPVTLPAAFTNPNAPGGLPAAPLHGFHGRAGELLRLERLLADHAVVVLHGYGGQGKTALASEAARWLHRTGRFPGGAAFIAFERGGGAELALSWTRQALLGDDFATVEQVADSLRQRPGLVIFDNFESVLAHGDAPLADADLRSVLDLAWCWAGDGDQRLDPNGPRVLITTRDVDFRDARLAPSQRCAHVQLGGLGRGEALELGRAVLADRGIDHAKIDREGLSRLMDLLGGHPLSLNLVLPQLAEQTPSELVADFDALLPGFTTGAAKERNESLAVSLEFSLRRLGEASRAALPDLGVFAGLAMEDDLLAITQLDPALWATARTELVGAGLATLEQLPFTDVPYIRFHPTLLPYLRARLAADRRRSLDERYWQRYAALARYFYQEDTKNPHFVRALVQRDLPNLRRGLDLALAHAAARPGDAAALEAAVDFADSVNRFLDVFGLRQERARVQERVDALLAAREGDLTRAEYLALSNRGEALQAAGRAREAEALFRDLLARLPAADTGGDAWGYERAVTIHHLGRTLADQGRPEQAAAAYRQELTLLARLAQSDTVKREAGAAHTGLADVLRDLGRYVEARAEYEASIEAGKSVDDARMVAVSNGQLGTLALQQRDYAEARRRHGDALAAFQRLDEPGMEAVAWHQLGIVAQEERAWDEAERCYRESVRLKEAAGDLPGVARTANQLGIVCVNAGRPAEAETWHRRALDAFATLGDRRSEAACANNLASLLLAVAAQPPAAHPAPFQGRDLLAEAAALAERAIAVKETLGVSTEPWLTYNILADIAERRGQGEAARAWRRKARASFAAFPGAWANLPNWVEGVAQAVAAACGGNSAAQNQVEGMFPQFERGNWRIVGAIRRIWAGERDLEALTDDIDRNSALIVQRILGVLAGEPAPFAQPAAPSAPAPAGAPAAAEGEGFTLEQLFGLVAAACQGDAQARQMAPLLVGMLQQPAMPAEIQALGGALARILAGERDPGLAADLPEELGQAVIALLGELG